MVASPGWDDMTDAEKRAFELGEEAVLKRIHARPDRVIGYAERAELFNQGRKAGYEIALQNTGDYLENRGYAMLAEEVTSHLHKSRPPELPRAPYPIEFYYGLAAMVLIFALGGWMF